MSALTRTAIFITIIFGAAFCAMAHSSGQQLPAGAISGRVTLSGKPAPNIKVMLMPSEADPRMGRPAAKGVTIFDGSFQITRVPAGSYNVFASAPAYYFEKAESPFEGTIPVTLEDGETIEGINIALKRGGVIAGRLTEASGRPLVRENIHLDRFNDKNQKQNTYWPNPVMFYTDDRGVFRLYGLPPGRYLVSAGVDKKGDIRGWQGAFYYERTFHPGVTNESKATFVELAEGGEATGIDIVMGGAEKAYAAIGRIVDADTGKPLANLDCGYGTVSPNGRGFFTRMIGGIRSNAKGEFRIEGIVPGHYAAFIFPSEGNDLYGEPTVFDVTDGDTSGIEIRVKHGASISGVAVIEGADAQQSASKVSETTIAYFVSLQPGQLSLPRSNRIKINPDGTFQITGLNAGKVGFQVSDYPPKGFHLIRIERDGVETGEGFDIAAGENITGIKLVIAYGSGIIRGQVKYEEGMLPDEAQIIVSGRRVNDAASFRQISARADIRGRFEFKGLLPGEYEIFVNDGGVIAKGGGQVSGLRASMQKVTVTDGLESNVTLQLQQEAKDN